MTLAEFRSRMTAYPHLTTGVDHLPVGDAIIEIAKRANFRQINRAESINNTMDELFQFIKERQ